MTYEYDEKVKIISCEFGSFLVIDSSFSHVVLKPVGKIGAKLIKARGFRSFYKAVEAALSMAKIVKDVK